jgi:branched-chain amino acid transport system ATP-binding protein
MSDTSVTSPTNGGTAVLSVQGLEVRYGPLSAVRGVTFDVQQGQVVVLLGANGAGKSSLLKAIVGLEPIANGSATLAGKDLRHLPTHRRIGLGMGYLPEGRGVFPNMTVQENILAGVRRNEDRQDVMDQAFELFPVLSERRKQIAGSMSGGEQQMLSLSRALAGKPTVLLVDELSLGLAPKIVAQLFEKVGELRNTGVTLVLVEQFAHTALRVADYAGVFVRGDMIRFAPAAELASLTPDELAHLYFGTADGTRPAGGLAATTKATTEDPDR